MSDQTLHLTDQQVRDGLNKAVEERGADFRYQAEYGLDEPCKNFVDGKPACVAGNVYAQYGIEAPPSYDVWEAGTVLWLSNPVGPNRLTFESDRGRVALLIAQRWQDAGYTWGQARDAALKFLDGDDSVDQAPEYIVDLIEDEK